MRYLFFAIVSIICLIFTGAVFPNLNIADIYPDIIIASIVSITILEKSMAGAMVALFCGLMLDLIFSDAIGLYGIPYFGAGALVFFVMKNLKYSDKVLLPMSLAIGAYMVKEIVSALLAFLMGIEFSFPHMLVRYILPKAAATAVLILLIHMLFSKIYRSSSMKLKSSDDFKHL